MGAVAAIRVPFGAFISGEDGLPAPASLPCEASAPGARAAASPESGYWSCVKVWSAGFAAAAGLSEMLPPAVCPAGVGAEETIRPEWVRRSSGPTLPSLLPFPAAPGSRSVPPAQLGEPQPRLHPEPELLGLRARYSQPPFACTSRDSRHAADAGQQPSAQDQQQQREVESPVSPGRLILQQVVQVAGTFISQS